MTRTQGMIHGARRNADTIGVGLPVIIMWVAATFGGVEVPAEVAVAIGGVIASVGAKIREVV